MLLAFFFTFLFSFLIVFSWLKIKNGAQVAEFIYSYGFLIGAFVWEDLLIFSAFGLAASIATIFLNQWKFGLLFYLVFWVVRSAGETLYFFLQQFLVPKHHPHYLNDHFGLLRRLFGKISYQQCLILMQVFFQIIMMTSVVCLITLLFSWNKIPQ